MLSRVAERVYWQSRYIERAENTARLLNVFSMLLLDLPSHIKPSWGALTEIIGAHALFAADGKQPSERNVMQFLLVQDNGVSLLSMLAMARENARATREIMPIAAFEQINHLYLQAKAGLAKAVARGPRHECLEEIINGCQTLAGILAGTMSRGAAYGFIRLGRGLERADMTTRIVEIGAGRLLGGVGKRVPAAVEPYQNTLWMSVLRSISAYQMYRQSVRERVNGKDVLTYLLQDREFPRSVAYCLVELERVLSEMPKSAAATSQARRVGRMLRQAKIDALLDDADLFLLVMDELQSQMAAVHEKIVATWLSPVK